MGGPLILVILDGWGLRKETQDNAIAQAQTPNYDRFLQEYPHASLDASGHAVGLPGGIMGNSEVGHLNIGAGRIAKVGLTRIYGAIEDKSFFRNPALLQATTAAKKNNSTLHLLGLLSDGGVHSHQDHLFALLELAKQQNLSQVAIHAFTDGRDTDPKIAKQFFADLEKKISELGIGQVATVIGRYYAMDRDQRWERTQRAYQAMVLGKGHGVSSAAQAVEQAYARGEGDEFIAPSVVLDAKGQPVAKLQDGDAAIFFNFRADRARQLTRALTETEFTQFDRQDFPDLASFVCMAEYDRSFDLPVAFPPIHIPKTLGEILSQRGLTQLRIAETEKYAHVTFFFNGGEEAVFPGEERILIPSPREVPTYDLKPEMSAPELGAKVVEMIKADRFDVIILNFANADMVGHSGKLPAAIKAVETIDAQLGKIWANLEPKGGSMVITADHGNCEKMTDAKGNPHTAHTTDLVPFLVVSDRWRDAKLRPQGTLADIAPTLLKMLNIPVPPEMTGQSMIR